MLDKASEAGTRLFSPHRRRLLKSSSTYKNLAIDAAWRMRRPPAAPPALTWPLDADRLAGVIARWPTSYLSGALGLQPAGQSRMARRLSSLRFAMSRMVETEIVDIPQPYKSIVLIEVMVDGTPYEVAIDQSPYLGVNDECAERCLLYFKRHHRLEVYPHANVLPGGFAPLKHEALHGHLHHLRRTNRQRHDVYARFSPHFSPEIRGSALQRLAAQTRFAFEGGNQLVMYSQYLRDIAGSRVCIDLPGEGPFTYRLVEYLAVGSCIVAYPHKARLHVPLRDREHIAYTKEDLSDFVELCDYFLRHPVERQRLAANAQSFFDRYLHRDQLAAYHLHSILARV
jgi:hypothetical protein